MQYFSNMFNSLRSNTSLRMILLIIIIILLILFPFEFYESLLISSIPVLVLDPSKRKSLKIKPTVERLPHGKFTIVTFKVKNLLVLSEKSRELSINFYLLFSQKVWRIDTFLCFFELNIVMKAIECYTQV